MMALRCFLIPLCTFQCCDPFFDLVVLLEEPVQRFSCLSFVLFERIHCLPNQILVRLVLSLVSTVAGTGDRTIGWLSLLFAIYV